MSVNANNSVAFKGIYKVSLPRVDKAKDDNEKAALTEASINSTLMGFNYSIDYPRINEQKAAVYYKIDDINDKNFEEGFKNIIDECNKAFNVDIAKKAYIQKVDENEFKEATPVNELE